MPIAVLFSCLIIIVSVVGVPSVMSGLASVFGDTREEVLHESAEAEVLFEDVTADSKYFDALLYLKNYGVISGFADNSYRPYQEMKRAELIKTIVNAKKSFPLALNYNSCFIDVQTQWFAPSVCFAKEKGWINGYVDGSFHPTESLTKVESLKMILDAFEIKIMENPEGEDTFEDLDRDAWYFPYVQTALKENLIEDNPNLEFYDPESPATRGSVAQIIYRAMQL